MIKRFPGPNMIIKFDQLQDEERAVVKAIRQNDLDQIRIISLYSLFPIALFSFAIGYLVSGRFLNPINKLKRNIDTLTHTDLGKNIPVEIEDEVGGLIMSFNELSQRLKNSFEVQESFVQDASHELKTPLTIIQTNLDTVIDDPKATQKELKEAINKALNGVKELRTLTNYLLDLTVNQEVEYKKTEINDLISLQVKNLKPIAKKMGVDLNWDGALANKGSDWKKGKGVQDDAFVMADELTLGRAIFNIIENAIKYSDKNLDGVKPFVKISFEKTQNNAIIKIADNGVGIPQEFQTKIFKRFFRTEKSRNKKLGGFGLGLAISKKTINDLGGKIEVISQKNDTTFTITLPLLKK
jgi:signal transduction histidine kinase